MAILQTRKSGLSCLRKRDVAESRSAGLQYFGLHVETEESSKVNVDRLESLVMAN